MSESGLGKVSVPVARDDALGLAVPVSGPVALNDALWLLVPVPVLSPVASNLRRQGRKGSVVKFGGVLISNNHLLAWKQHASAIT